MKKQTILKSILKVLRELTVIGLIGGFLCMLVVIHARGNANFTGNEVYYDKIVLLLFNRVVMYSAVAFAAIFFLNDALTDHNILKYPYLIINVIITLVTTFIAYIFIGVPVNNMASIADAGYHLQSMTQDYINYTNKATISLWIVLILLLILIINSICQPFGKREKITYKHRNVVLIVLGVCICLGIGAFAASEVRMQNMRNKKINDMDITVVPDGEYEGIAIYSNSEVRVKVLVKDHKIVSIEDPVPSERSITLYARGVFNKIIDKQTPNVDAISGATTTSKAYMKAVENALDTVK